MSAGPKPPLLSPAEYLRRERASEIRHDYYRGEMFAMSGASREHNLITLNVSAELRAQLKGGPCEAYSNDMRVKISAFGFYVYPDVVVACEERQFEDAEVDTLLNPRVVVEVLSPSTEAYDRGLKSSQYRRLKSLQEYVLISQAGILVEHYVRREGAWALSDLNTLDDVLVLPSIGCRVSLREIYDRVEFPASAGGEEPGLGSRMPHPQA